LIFWSSWATAIDRPGERRAQFIVLLGAGSVGAIAGLEPGGRVADQVGAVSQRGCPQL
jgi:hypothetical protein